MTRQVTASLTPAQGPIDPPSSAPLRGVLGGRVHAYRFIPQGGVQRIELEGVVVPGRDSVLRWAFYADGDDAALAPHAALAVTADLRFGDGTRLSDDPRVRDRYGRTIDPDRQFAARASMPEQWNENAVSLAPAAGRTGVIEVVLGAGGLDGAAEVTGFVEVIVEECPLPAGDTAPVDRVDTRRGSHAGDRYSRGNTIPAVAVPHGFTFVTPATDAADTRWPYRAFRHDDEDGRRLEALQFSHQPSPWIGDRGVLQLVPSRGDGADGPAARRWIMPGTEIARPHRYAASLDDGSTLAMTATSRVGVFRIDAAPGERIGFRITRPETAGGFTPLGDDRFEGWVAEGDAGWGNPPRTFFHGRVLGDAARVAAAGDGGGAVTATGTLEVRIALSFLSTDVARTTLEREAGPDTSFAHVAERAAAAWNAVLSRVTIPPLPTPEGPFRGLADAETRAAIAAALYRIHLYPNTMSENVGTDLDPVWRFADPFSPAADHTERETGCTVAAGELMVNNGYWDTYRTAWPALMLLDAVGSERLLSGLVAQYERGGFMARWSAPGYVDSMVGTSSDQIFADAERWGVAGDREAWFASGVRNALEPATDDHWGRKGLGRARFRGWVSRDVHEGMSWSLENAISDAALARFARRLSTGRDAYDAAARYLDNRSRAYRELFDADTGFFRGRESDGSRPTEPFDPRVWGGDYVETNAWGMSVTPVHDGAGLADLHGGPAGLRAHLDRLFETQETAEERFGGWYGTVIHEQREARGVRAGMCAISNQPAHHIPYMHVHGDRPWRAGELANDLAERLFGGAAIAQGFPGDEDNGEMSAWWLWAALGLYPLEPASGELVIGVPLVDDVTVTRSGGQTLRVRVESDHPAHTALVAAELNGVPLERAVLPVDALDHDAELVLHLGDDPASSPLWRGAAAHPRAWHPDLTRRAHLHGDVDDLERLRDDGDPSGDAGVALAAGQSIVLDFDDPVRITDVTVTTLGAHDRLPVSFSFDDTAGTTTHDQAVHPDRTVPLRIAAARAARRVRVRALDDVVLRQLELFTLDD